MNFANIDPDPANMTEEKKKLRKYLDEESASKFVRLYAKDDASVPKEIAILINQCLKYNYKDRPYI